MHLSVALPPGAATTTLVTTSGSPSTEGVSVTLTATVDPVPTGGTVQFYDNGTAIGAAATVDTLTGIATLATSDLIPGIHPITATYSGTSGFFTSTSSVVNQEVTEVPKVPTATVVTTSGSPSTFGASVTLTATVDPVPTGGTVQFYDDSVAIGAAATVNTGTGEATLVTTTLTVGSHPITATYSGTVGYATSTASVVTQEVTEAPTTTVVTTSGSPSTFGASVTLTATVDPVPTGGTVQFYDDSVAIGAAATVSTSTGIATLATSALTVGSHPITATYSGTIGFATSTDATGTTQIVNPASASLVYTQEFDGTGAPGSWTGWSALAGKTFMTNTGGYWGDSTNAYLATPNGTPSLYVYSNAVTCDFSLAVPAYGNMVSGNTYTVDLLSDHPSAYPWSKGCLISLVDLTTMETLSSVNVPAWSAANSNVWETLTLTATAGAGNATHPLGLVIDATRGDGFAQIAEVKLNVVPTGPPVETTTVVTGNGTSTVGTSVTLTATVNPTFTGGTVQFYDDTTHANIGTAQDVIEGIATVGADLAVGTHSIIATFSGTSAYALSVSTAVTQIVNPLQSAYEVWSAQITNGKAGATQDADDDAVPNFIEFAFNGNPMSAADNGMIHALTETSANHNNNKVLVLTIAVRTGGTTWGTNTATIDGITYTIEGGTTLGDFSPGDGKIFACETAIITGLPAEPGAGYEWRSFILNSSESLGGKGFLRAKVEQD